MHAMEELIKCDICMLEVGNAGLPRGQRPRFFQNITVPCCEGTPSEEGASTRGVQSDPGALTTGLCEPQTKT